jgi:hypothetical protein
MGFPHKHRIKVVPLSEAEARLDQLRWEAENAKGGWQDEAGALEARAERAEGERARGASGSDLAWLKATRKEAETRAERAEGERDAARRQAKLSSESYRSRDAACQEAEADASRYREALERIANWKLPKVWDGETDMRADATDDFQDIARSALHRQEDTDD